ncbi:MAG: DUF433 domain-containing protein [Candidatus Omnitrophica bacterium]|nr:DUF433 domain-containing protein [Candidatus Omnitrophota bacterium]
MNKPFDRITCDPRVLNGQACVRGLRIPVHLVLDLLASGEKPAEILADYPDLNEEDIKECLEYGAWLAREESFPVSA